MKLAAALGEKVNKVDNIWQSDKEMKKTHEISLDTLTAQTRFLESTSKRFTKINLTTKMKWTNNSKS